MKRRLLPMMMTLVLVCALPIWAAFVTSGDVTNPLVCTADATSPPEPAEVSTATDLQNRIADGKSVKLTDNITITSTLEIARSLTLDLNGYVLKMGGTGRVIHIIKSHGYDVKVEIKDGEPGKEHTGEYAALPAGGVITGGKADKGGGILLDGGCTLKLTGGCITDCHATDTGGGGVVLNGDTAILYMSGTARIENCTAGKMWGAAIFNSGTMYADGGTVDGTVNNQGTIRRSEGAAAETVFNGTVYNRSAGTIIAGIYNETVENNGTITGGTFYGPIVNEVGSGQVTGGTFAVTFDRGDGTKTGPELVGYKGTVSRPPSDPEKSGHTFVGWYLGDALYDFNTPVTAPLTLTARWKEVPSSSGYYYYPTTDAKTDDTKGSPKTADPGAALYGALALLSLTGMVALNGKKR